MTFSSACSAREKPPQADITIIDSQGAVAGEALIVLAVAKAAQEGGGKTEIVNLIHDLIPRVDTLFTANTLEYLHRGGRLTAPQVLLGKLLGFRPILRLREEKIVPVGRARSRWQSIAQLCVLDDLSPVAGTHLGPGTLGVGYYACPN